MVGHHIRVHDQPCLLHDLNRTHLQDSAKHATPFRCWDHRILIAQIPARKAIRVARGVTIFIRLPLAFFIRQQYSMRS